MEDWKARDSRGKKQEQQILNCNSYRQIENLLALSNLTKSQKEIQFDTKNPTKSEISSTLNTQKQKNQGRVLPQRARTGACPDAGARRSAICTMVAQHRAAKDSSATKARERPTRVGERGWSHMHARSPSCRRGGPGRAGHGRFDSSGIPRRHPNPNLLPAATPGQSGRVIWWVGAREMGRGLPHWERNAEVFSDKGILVANLVPLTSAGKNFEMLNGRKS